MNIREATIKALTSNGYMFRRNEDILKKPDKLIKPSHNVEKPFTMYSTSEKPVVGWQPSANDVLADDWEVVPSFRVRGKRKDSEE